ncbi:MAG: hypothetical protein ACRC9L_06755 [Brevinema sp.]
MPDLPSFAHKHNDLDDMLARFDADVMQIEKNFDSLKGSLAALGQGLTKESISIKENAPKFHADLDQIFADFDQEVHKALTITEIPQEEVTESVVSTDIDKSEAVIVDPPITEPNFIELPDLPPSDLPPLPEEEISSFAMPAQKELDTIAQEVKSDLSEFLVEEVTPITPISPVVNNSEQIISPPLPETFIVGEDVIEDIDVVVTKDEVMIGSIPVIEEIIPTPIDIEEVTPTQNYEEISIESVSPRKEFSFDSIAPLDIPSTENTSSKEEDSSFSKIITRTIIDLDQLQEASITTQETDLNQYNTSTYRENVSDISIEKEQSIPSIDIESKEDFTKIFSQEDHSITYFEPQQSVPSIDLEEEALSTDELLAIPTMPAEPAKPAEMSIDLNAEAEILARFESLNTSSKDTNVKIDTASAPETRIATSSTRITSLSRDELASVMAEIDILLEYLPNHKIEELAHKDFYFLYLRLLDDLGV